MAPNNTQENKQKTSYKYEYSLFSWMGYASSIKINGLDSRLNCAENNSHKNK